ncbi:MAG: prenyltransferase/squalene oxidase repeat-containing protein [Phycisphaerales bacterium]
MTTLLYPVLLAVLAAQPQTPQTDPASANPRIAPAQAQAEERMVQQAVAQCPIKAEPPFKDFGFVPPRKELTLEARIVNPLDRPVTCIRSVPTCQCTTMDMLGKVIPAKGSITVPVSMKTSGATGEKVAAVRMQFEGVPGIVEVKLRAEVAYSVRCVQDNRTADGRQTRDAFVNAFDFPEQTKGVITVEAIDGKPFRVLSLQGVAPVFVGWDPAKDAPRASYQVRYDFSAAPCDQVPKYLLIETDRADAPLVDMRVRHNCTRISPSFGFGQYRENLGLLHVGEPGEFSVEIKHANGVRIDSVTSKDPRLAAQLVGVKSDGDSLLATVRVTPQEGASGVFMAPLLFTGVGPDPKQPVPPGQPAVTAPRMADFLVYLKALPKQSAAAAAGAPTPAAGPLSAATRAAVLAVPSTPRDTRVDAAKIKTVGDPAVPAAVVQPLPVVARIAERAEEVPMDPARFAKAKAAVDKGLAYFEGSQGPNGGWMEGTPAKGTDQTKSSNAASVAVTGMVLKAFAQSGRTALADGRAQRALDYVLSSTNMRGEFTPDPKGGLSNYVAAFVLMGLAAQQDAHLARELETVRLWLVNNQWDQAKGISPKDDWYGGAGYGRHGRPDLSNTQIMLEALHDAGASPDDPAVQRALVFVLRTQNSKQNPASWAQAGSGDGGFVYTPVNGGETFASEDASEKLPEGAAKTLRSYGSMTYAGFKSMLYAGLAPKDERVLAAYDWIRRHFTFDQNPGLGAQGHFYYLHAMARALNAAGQAVIVDADGKPHNWRDELADALLVRQRTDGAWVNTADRWQESQPDLVTAYSVLALQEALKPVLRAQ